MLNITFKELKGLFNSYHNIKNECKEILKEDLIDKLQEPFFEVFADMSITIIENLYNIKYNRSYVYELLGDLLYDKWNNEKEMKVILEKFIKYQVK